MGITDSQLSEFRRTMQSILIQTCDILSTSYGSDDTGGWDETAGTVATGVPCRLARQKRDRELSISGGNSFVATEWEYILKVKHDQAIEPDNTVIVEGGTYTVEQVNDDHQWVMVKTCRITRIRS